MKIMTAILVLLGAAICCVLAMAGRMATALLIAAGIGLAVAAMTAVTILSSKNEGAVELPDGFDELPAALEAADRKKIFGPERKVLSGALASVLIKIDFFDDYGKDSSVRKAYDMICAHIVRNVRSAIRWIDAYDYVLKPGKDYLTGIVSNTKQLSAKLSELSDTCIRIDDSADKTDTAYADDLLASLRDMLADDE